MSGRTAIALASLLSLALTSSFAGAVARSPNVERSVYEQLQQRADGRVYVIVVLRKTGARPLEQQRSLQAEVASIENGVLSGLAATEFEPAYRFENFAGFTGRVTSSGLEKIAAHPDVVAIGPDARGNANLDVSVPFIRADLVHSSLNVTGAGSTVAVLDSGIDTDHPDLSDDLAPGAYHFLDQGATVGPGAEDDNGHGSNVAGIITAKGVVSAKGVAPDANILAVKVLDSGGSGWLSDWTAGVDYVVTQAGSIPHLCAINMSLGSFTLFSTCPCDAANSFNAALGAAIQSAEDAGIATFCSSGNSGSTTSMSSPACLAAAVAVVAVYDQNLGREPNSGTYQDNFGSSFGACFDAATGPDVITCFSNRNACNDLAAPGRQITAPYPGGGLGSYTGTSQASPHAAGVAALMCQRARFTSMTPDQMVAIMKSTGVPIAGGTPQPVRVDAKAAVDATPTGVPGLLEPLRGVFGALLLLAGAASLRWRRRAVAAPSASASERSGRC